MRRKKKIQRIRILKRKYETRSYDTKISCQREKQRASVGTRREEKHIAAYVVKRRGRKEGKKR